MGCDIEFMVERRKSAGEWEHVSFECFQGRRPNDHELAKANAWYDGSNYFLFGVLAGVREPTVPPASGPRGFPDDVSEWVRYFPHGAKDWTAADWLRELYVDDPGEMVITDLCTLEETEESFFRSWLGLDEIIAYNWDAPLPYQGYVNAREYAAWLKAGGKPQGFSRAVDGGTIVSNETMELLLEEHGAAGLKQYKTLLSWAVPIREYCPWFLEKTVKWMMELAEGDPTTVRAVFHFDC